MKKGKLVLISFASFLFCFSVFIHLYFFALLNGCGFLVQKDLVTGVSEINQLGGDPN